MAPNVSHIRAGLGALASGSLIVLAPPRFARLESQPRSIESDVRRSILVAAGLGDGCEQVLDGRVVVGEKDPPGAAVDFLFVLFGVRSGLDEPVMLEEFRVAVAT